MTIELDSIVDAARAAFAEAATPADLENAKAQFIGKSGRITELMKGMAALQRRREEDPRRGDQPGQAGDRGGAERAPPGAGRRRTRRPAQGRGAGRLAARPPARAGRPAPGQPDHGAHRADLRQHGLRRGRRPRDRERLAQLHLAEQPAQPSGAVDAGHVLRRHQGRRRHPLQPASAHQPDAGALCARSTSRSTPGREAGGRCRRSA